MATTPIELDQDFTSPYKRTRLFVKKGRAFFGIWNPPPVLLDGDEEQVLVEPGFEVQLDLFADAVYGDRRLWRVIAQANHIDFPLRDVVAGMKLIIPKPAHVFAALLATTSRQGRDD
jgi:hypothetical protein